MNDGDIIRVDRKRAWRFIAISAAVGVVLIVVLSRLYAYFKGAMPTPDTHLTPERIEELRLQLRITMLALTMGMAACCIPIVVRGARNVKHEAYPPPGSLALRDTRITRGRRALWRGYLPLTLGAASAIGCLVLAWLIDHMLTRAAS